MAIASCRTVRNSIKSNTAAISGQKINYDTGIINQTATPYLLPYNRIIDGAGTVVRFGSTDLENHSLDAALLPGKKTLAVEDRYGIAMIDVTEKKLLFRLAYDDKNSSKKTMSVYNGIKVFEIAGQVHLFWSAADAGANKSYVFDATWDGKKATITNTILFDAASPSPLALPNDIALQNEAAENYLYVVLNGNSQLVKMRLRDKKIVWQSATGMAPFGLAIANGKAYVTNWAGPVPTDPAKETAGVPYAAVYTNPVTGATALGTVSVFDITSASH